MVENVKVQGEAWLGVSTSTFYSGFFKKWNIEVLFGKTSKLGTLTYLEYVSAKTQRLLSQLVSQKLTKIWFSFSTLELSQEPQGRRFLLVGAVSSVEKELDLVNGYNSIILLY